MTNLNVVLVRASVVLGKSLGLVVVLPGMALRSGTATWCTALWFCTGRTPTPNCPLTWSAVWSRDSSGVSYGGQLTACVPWSSCMLQADPPVCFSQTRGISGFSLGLGVAPYTRSAGTRASLWEHCLLVKCKVIHSIYSDKGRTYS